MPLEDIVNTLEETVNSLLKNTADILLDPNVVIIGGGALIILWPLLYHAYALARGIGKAVVEAAPEIVKGLRNTTAAMKPRDFVVFGAKATIFSSAVFLSCHQYKNLTTQPIKLYFEASEEIALYAKNCAERGNYQELITCIQREVKDTSTLTQTYYSCEEGREPPTYGGYLFYQSSAVQICVKRAGTELVRKKCYEQAARAKKEYQLQEDELSLGLKFLRFNRCSDPLIKIKRYFNERGKDKK